MALHSNPTPRFIEVVNTNDELKKQVKVFVGNISEKEALIMFDEDLDKKLFAYLKKMCRGSFEYKEYIKHFREVLEQTDCKVLGIDIKDVPVGLEIHHTPFALETIVRAVTNRFYNERGTPLDPKDIAEEVMQLHYDGKVGLIPLTSSMHEAVHANAIHLKVSDIYGNYQKFFAEYEQWLDDDAIRHYNNVISMTDEEVDLYNREKLKRVISEYEVVYEGDEQTKTNLEFLLAKFEEEDERELN